MTTAQGNKAQFIKFSQELGIEFYSNISADYDYIYLYKEGNGLKLSGCNKAGKVSYKLKNDFDEAVTAFKIMVGVI